MKRSESSARRKSGAVWTVGDELFFPPARPLAAGGADLISTDGQSAAVQGGFASSRLFLFGEERMEDVMANFNDSLVTKVEEESSSQSLEAILSSGQVDTRTGLLNALVIIRFD